jgi:hypothetical protein
MKQTGKEFAQMLNGFDMKLRKESQQDRQIFAVNPEVDLPDTVGVYHKNEKRFSLKIGIVLV